MSTETDLIDTKGITSVLGLTSVEYVRNDLIGIVAVMEMLAVPNKARSRMVVLLEGFPKPLINFSAISRKWLRQDVQDWLMSHADSVNAAQAALKASYRRRPDPAPAPRMPKAEDRSIDQQAMAAMREAKKRAKRRAMEFDLTKEWVLKALQDQGGKCAVSGIWLSMERVARARGHPFAPSVDRINNNRGYTIDNVRIVCTSVNMMMNQWGDRVFHRIATAIRKSPQA